jgi:hypothetical protein
LLNFDSALEREVELIPSAQWLYHNLDIGTVTESPDGHAIRLHVAELEVEVRLPPRHEVKRSIHGDDLSPRFIKVCNVTPRGRMADLRDFHLAPPLVEVWRPDAGATIELQGFTV